MLLLEGFLVSVVGWVLWKTFRHYIIRTSLDNIPGPQPTSFIYGSLTQLLHPKNGWGFVKHLSETYDGVAVIRGVLGRKILYVFDPTAMHHVIVKDHDVFEEAEWFLKSNFLRFGPGIVSTLGETHRRQRKMLNPVFSISHMRHMVPIFFEVGHRLVAGMESQAKAGETEADMLKWFSRTALELIGQAGLGYSFDPLVSDTTDEFAAAVKAYVPAAAKLQIERQMVPYFSNIGTAAFRRWVLDHWPGEGVQVVKRSVDTIYRRAVEIFELKKRALEAGDNSVLQSRMGDGKDLMTILLKANLEATEGNRLPDDELIAQIGTFIFAAMDTTSNALSVTLQLLAEHPDVQQKLREEFSEVWPEGQDSLDHDTLVNLPYLDAVCRETLRLHAPVPLGYRDSRADAVVPLSHPIRGKDGRMMHEVVVPKGTTVAIGILSSNKNKELWGEDADEWKPERWLKPLPESVTEAKIPGVYSNLMTFLGGSRACIGFKFSQLEMKVILVLLLRHFSFKPSVKPIHWQFSTIRYPSADPNGGKASMPVGVELLKSAGGHN